MKVIRKRVKNMKVYSIKKKKVPFLRKREKNWYRKVENNLSLQHYKADLRRIKKKNLKKKIRHSSVSKCHRKAENNWDNRIDQH